jgi:mannose-6-phosphate isomerase-like protein (cupin superfamily)
MAGYTTKNLMDLDDLAAGRGVDIQARFARSHIDSEHLGVSYFRYGPDARSPVGHHHETQEEAYVVVSGNGRMKLDDDIIELKQWDVIRVAPQVIRGFEAGPDGLELIAIGADRPPDGDGVMVNDWWTE